VPVAVLPTAKLLSAFSLKPKSDRLLDSLVIAGWLRKSSIQTAGRPIHRREVNPMLFASNAESAESAESI
jgi:hypothetical protein